MKIRLLNKISATEKSGAINMLIKPISMVISIVYTPLLLAFLGDEKYGLWATLLSVINWINYFDVGIGNGLRNLLSKEIAEDEKEGAQKSVSTAYTIISAIAFVVFVALLISVFALDWKTIFSTAIDMKWPLLISFAFICINFILALSNTLLYALQKSERVSIRACLVQIINLVGVLLLGRLIDGSLVAMAVLFGMSTLVVYLYNTVHIFAKYDYLRPSIVFFERCKIRQICDVGIKFFAIQIFCLMLFTVDNLLITHFFGAAEVTPFSIVNKVFNTAYSLFAAFLVPYWSRSAVAFAEKDYRWVKNAIHKVLLFFLLFFASYILLAVIFDPLVSAWLGRKLQYQPSLVPVMCIFYSLYSLSGFITSFTNGSGKVNVQLVVFAIAGILNIPFSIYLGVTKQLGTVGIRLATTILMFFSVIVLAIDLYNIVRTLRKESKIA